MPWIFGRELANTRRAALKTRLQIENHAPRLAVLLVGHDPASELYVRLKQRAANEAGITFTLRHEDRLTTEEAITIIQEWNADSSIHGILVQLPLPNGLDTDAIIQAINPKKDVDAFHPDNRAALIAGRAQLFSPVHLAVLYLIAQTPLHLNGAETLLLAKSDVFSEPLAHLLRKAGAVVTISPDVPSARHLAEFSLVVTSIGQAGSLRGEMLDSNCVIIDISTNTKEGSTVGDFDKNTLQEHQWASPVPGGVGPLTIAFLLENVVAARDHQSSIETSHSDV
ncbi:bifunctional 5,10-methylenetetrahydrofolate dehydrogenase/5,10-methenyltetrahydrofolate cyclohydrolase [Patescibacteria group bacterium]|nr:bifunctional 5,10-methylenetetrahydrofolate dehydrogenase/5,10-methenyltetrahydrofolate cyclohydrolase [Patescibacteria group bacterium]